MYIFDQNCKLETERFYFLHRNLVDSCAADLAVLTKELGDWENTWDNTDAARAERIFIWSSACVGCNLYLPQKMHDIVAISNNAGYTEILFTKICSLKCPETKNALLPGQTVTDHPELATRVFLIKPLALMAFIFEEKMFGEVRTYAGVIKFKKGGIPKETCIFFRTLYWNTALFQSSLMEINILAEIPPKTNPPLCKSYWSTTYVVSVEPSILLLCVWMSVSAENDFQKSSWKKRNKTMHSCSSPTAGRHRMMVEKQLTEHTNHQKKVP